MQAFIHEILNQMLEQTFSKGSYIEKNIPVVTAKQMVPCHTISERNLQQKQAS